MTRTQGVAVWARKWRDLKCWGRPLREVRIELRMDNAQGNLGWCYQCQREIVVKCRPDMPCTLRTVLHELAHAAVGAEFEAHGSQWREMFARAIEEVTGIAIPAADSDAYNAVDGLATEAMRYWWKSNGFDRLWKMAADRRK